MHWETKKFVTRFIAMFRYMLYCGGLELNLQYLRGVPVYSRLFLTTLLLCL